MEVERECAQLGTLFQSIVTDLKASSPAWEDFVSKGTKLHSLLRSTTTAMTGFVESIQKIADMATNTKGSTKDVGSALTRICVRQKMMENKLKHFTNALLEKLIFPVQERLEEWKKVANQLEKDHAKGTVPDIASGNISKVHKGTYASSMNDTKFAARKSALFTLNQRLQTLNQYYKKSMFEIKRRNSDTLRLQKKLRKGSKSDIQHQLNSAMHDVNERFTTLEEIERSALRNLLVEERSRICLFANCLSPVLDLQVSMLNEVTHMQDVTADISKFCRNPKQLPTSTDQLVQDFISVNNQPLSPLQDIDSNGFLNSPPPSPTSSGSRKSSLCSMNSLTSGDSRSSGSLNRTSSFRLRHCQSSHRRNTSGSIPGQGSSTPCPSGPTGPAVARLSSVSSYDSGFVSTGNGAIPPDGAEHGFKQQMSLPCGKTELGDDVADGVPPIIRSRSNSEQTVEPTTPSFAQGKTFSWKDWSKPGPYDPPAPPVNDSDSRRNVLPSKPTPPPLSPKPSYLSQHSVEETKSSRPIPPFLHANTTPCFFPALPPKDDNLLPLPPADKNTFSSLDVGEDPLPPPPSALLNHDDRALSNTTTSTSESFHLHHELPVEDASNHENSQKSHMNQYTAAAQEFHSMTLGRKNSNHSLQYSSSSGYSSQNTTPACSEDTIASHETDNCSVDNEEQQPLQSSKPAADHEKYSTLPRNYHHGNRNNKHPSKRPASTAGIPAYNAVTSELDSGTATIRRKPSSKFNSVRRTTSGPKPIQTPTIPNNIPLMSAFAPPSEFTDGTNPKGSSSDPSRFHESHEAQHASRNLTLQSQKLNGLRNGAPAPFKIPTTSDSRHGNRFYPDSDMTSHSNGHMQQNC